MTPETFVAKWKAATTSERASAQSHFNDLCELLDEPKPHDVDPNGEWFAFEKGAAKTTGGDGWADVWRKGCFAWEYKGKHKDLTKAFVQLQQYAGALQNPPLLIVSDIERIRIVTNWNDTVNVTHELTLDDLLSAEKRRLLKSAFSSPESLRPSELRAHLTAKVADKFATLARELGEAGHEAQTVAHFINRLVFCMFAEDIGILPDRLFTKLIEKALREQANFDLYASELFKAMCTGGSFGLDQIAWFNGGLFDDSTALPLDVRQVRTVADVAKNDWSAIDPSIFGTLFERGLDPAKRSQLGAHYTDPENIMRIVEPVVLRPLRQEWEEAKAKIQLAKQPAKRKAILAAYLERLRAVKVLDPACGSGNFLYVALKCLKDFELLVLLEAEELGFEKAYPELDVSCVKGIELSPFAAELARVTVWIGELQWQIEHGFDVQRNPILKVLETIENRDALLMIQNPLPPSGEGRVGAPEVVEAAWPAADFIIGNPPFLGGKLLRKELGDTIVDRLYAVYDGRVHRESDLCIYWFEKARAQIELGLTKRAGLIGTQGIRGSANRLILDRIKKSGDIFSAWSDLDWVLEGAAVHVSIVGFDSGAESTRVLDGTTVTNINPDLTSMTNVTTARRLIGNVGLYVRAPEKGGPFEIDDEVARVLLLSPNPSTKPSSDVLRPWFNAEQLVQKRKAAWIIDFDSQTTEYEASQYAACFEIVERIVKPARAKNNDERLRRMWWRFRRSGEGVRAASNLDRILATPAVSKHRIFAWRDSIWQPDKATIPFAVDDDYTFGVLHSRFHEVWALAQGTQLEDRPRYTPTTCFETFPFPEPTDVQRQAISDAARELNELRENWLNPPEWMREETLIFPATVGGPWDRWIPQNPLHLPRGGGQGGGAAATANSAPVIADAHYVRRVPKPAAVKMVADRTLTKLYNTRPAWLRHAHEKLDTAVAAAYGIDPNVSEPDLLAFLLDLNLARSAPLP